jgi:hypothetical protein
MKNAIPIVSALACAVSLNAQITVNLNSSPTRSPEIGIRNQSTARLTAFAVSMSPAKGAADDAPFVVFVDAAVDTDARLSHQLKTAMPLEPNQGYMVPVPARLRPGQSPEALFEPPIVAAAVFADGTTTGDTSLLSRLILRRCNMLQAVELAGEILSDAGRRNVPRRQMIDQFQKLADSVNHWYLPPEQQVGRVLYQSIIEKLLNLPELRLGSPFPPTAFVEQETARLNRQRTALLESRPDLAAAGPLRH